MGEPWMLLTEIVLRNPAGMGVPDAMNALRAHRLTDDEAKRGIRVALDKELVRLGDELQLVPRAVREVNDG